MLQVLHWGLHEGNACFSILYGSGLWIPVATAKRAIRNGYNMMVLGLEHVDVNFIGRYDIFKC